jgi:dTMP kinase
MNGRFITLEGGEGAGKSTCLQAVVEELTAHGKAPLVTREPGGTALGEGLREFLLRPGMEIGARAELLMVFAARAQHVDTVIRPAVERGTWVLSDRFTDASFAYQGGGRGVAEESIEWLEQWVQQGLSPDLTLLLDVDPEVGLRRATGDREADRLEQEDLKFYQRVRAAYLQRAEAEPERFRVIDASRPLSDVVDQVRSCVRDFLRVENG